MKHFYRLFIGSCLSLMAGQGFAQDRTADSLELVNLYNTTNGAEWTNSSNWNSTTQPINTWYGVHLSTAGRVDSLTLPSNNITGPLPGTLIDNLGMLAKIDLSNNMLTGSVPYLNNANVKILNVSRNQLSGTLNYFGQAGLETLDVSYNQITGALPDWNNFNGLVTFNLSHNMLTGSLGAQNFSHIQFFDISYNQFSGSIPYIAGANIRTFDASHNMFTGTIGYYDNPPNLQVFNVSYNQLTGGLPYFTMPAINILNVSHNQLTGSVGYYNTPVITNFEIDHNLLTGSLNFNTPESLKVFTANANKLSGAIVANLSGLTTVRLDSNKYTFTELESKISNLPAGSVYAPQDTILAIHYNIVADKLSVSAGGTLSNNTYNWYMTGGTLAGTTNGDSTFTPTENGMYYVMVTNSATANLTLSSDTVMVSGILPVTFTTINAQSIYKDKATFARVVWETATEINNKQFEVRRSLNGTEWNTVTVVASKANAGNSTSLLSYSYDDNISPLSGVIYYKLRQVDYDGNAKFSPVVTVNKVAAGALSFGVYPNPVSSGNLNVKVLAPQNEQLQLRLVNSSGITVYTGKKMNVIAGENVLIINEASRLASGIYILQVYNSHNELIGTVKINK